MIEVLSILLIFLLFLGSPNLPPLSLFYIISALYLLSFFPSFLTLSRPHFTQTEVVVIISIS